MKQALIVRLRMQANAQSLSLIVGVQNHHEVINLLNSVDEDIEVIVVLNNPSPAIRKLFDHIKFTTFTLKTIEINISNLGQIKNSGIQAAANDNLLFLDADCVLEKGTLKKIIDCLQDQEIGKVNVVIQTNDWLNNILAKNRIPEKYNAAYTPGVFFKKSLANKLSNCYYQGDLPWREDYEFKQRTERLGIYPFFLKDAIVFHPPYKLLADIRTAFRCGGGHQIGCYRNYIKPTLKWGGGNNFIRSVVYDLYRIPYLFTIQLFQDWRRFGSIAALYKIVWKTTFTFGYYSQMFFKFLDKQI